ncbi:MAG: 23S rRNA (uracil(1939)-C(5))-methyltransferase RlmD [Candidatus Gracilibacteria bacterium]|nr:23S rRNA (uracil(1939)-C(5))-methyltransferase RlmD [Candidatus Gracilibacteria bacterium]
MRPRPQRSPAVQALKKGEEIEVKIEKLVLGGMGLGLYDASDRIPENKADHPDAKKPLRVFVERALPGQILRVRIKQKKPRYVIATIVEVIQESALAIHPKCPYFANSEKVNDQSPSCGGCLWQNLSYEEQLKVKDEQVRDTLTRIGKIENLEMEPIIASPEPWFYRNKIELSFGINADGYTDFGFRERGKFNSIIPIESCVIFDEKLPAVLDVIRRYVRMLDVKPFDFQKCPDGFWQFLIIRRGVQTGEWMINFVTRPGEIIDRHLADELQEMLGESLQSVLHTVNFGKAISYMGHKNKKVEVLFGRDYILEELGGLRFKISPFSFFQTNTLAAERLYEQVREFAALKGHERVLDMYCGTGTIGQYLARDAREVVGMEILPEAIDDANENSRINNLANCTYLCGDVDKILFESRNKFLHVDMIILDPPRAGIAKKALKKVLSLMPEVVIYVSCNPATLARDLFDFRSKGYEVVKVRALDLFPQTHHVETVVRLERKKRNIKRVQ